jgi:xylose isomerase
MADAYSPKKSDKFTFGLWTVGNPGRDPFGDAVRSPLAAPYMVKKLAECGAWGVNLHDNDLVPFGASAAEQDKIVKEFKQALADHDMVVPMATTNLFGHPIFKDGGFTANDPKVRAFAIQKTMRSMDLGVELGAAARASRSTPAATRARHSSGTARRSTTSASTRSTRSTT